jgi:hypothetical protein
MNTYFKVFASYNILQYMCDFIHVLTFETVSKCQKSPKVTNIVMSGVWSGFTQIGGKGFPMLLFSTYTVATKDLLVVDVDWHTYFFAPV